MQIYQADEMCEDDMPEESECDRMTRTPTPPTLSPPAITLQNREELAYEEPFSGKNIEVHSYLGQFLVLWFFLKS